LWQVFSSAGGKLSFVVVVVVVIVVVDDGNVLHMRTWIRKLMRMPSRAYTGKGKLITRLSVCCIQVGGQVDEDAHGGGAEPGDQGALFRCSDHHRQLPGAALEAFRRRKLFPFTS